jgi:hypothetical protein
MPDSPDIKVNELTPPLQPDDFPTVTKGSQAIEWLKTTRGIITGLVAVLVVLPSLFNAFIDVYISFFNIPKSINEHNNQQLFQEHFQEKPINSGMNIIKTASGNLSMKISIYRNGDIFVEYGDYSQWFPYRPPKDNKPKSTSWLISNAFAEDAPTLLSPCEVARQGVQSNMSATTSYLLRDLRQGEYLIRERTYADGCKETLSINTSTGQIVQRRLENVELSEEQKQSLNQGQGIQLVPRIIDTQH